MEASRRQSLASSLVIKHLHPAADVGADDEGLFLSSLLLPMSRVLFDLAFPDLYHAMISHCRQTKCSLASLERRVLPMSPGRALAGLLARWKLSPRLFKPLQHSGTTYRNLCTLTEPLRSKVERLRVSELLGYFAVGRFEPWDEIDFPLPETMARLRANDLETIIDNVRADLAQLPDGESNRQSRTEWFGDSQKGMEIGYLKLAVESHDLLALLLDSIGANVVRVSREAACQPNPVLVSCLDVTAEKLEWFLDDAIPDSGRALICSLPLPVHCDSWGSVVQLPTSFVILSEAIRVAAKQH